MTAHIQGIGFCAQYMVLVLPRVCSSHPRELPGRNVSDCNGDSPHDSEGKLVLRSQLVHGGASEPSGNAIRQILASVISCVAA